jgi:hypothetical protein
MKKANPTLHLPPFWPLMPGELEKLNPNYKRVSDELAK